MECNRDEAVRAKEIAERKFNAKDIAGAKKFALKAKALSPGLEGIAQMLATFDVYLSAENRKNGEADWYGVLDVAHSCDDETIRKKYRKLALILHPDKNKSVGAEGAFKYVSAAWSVLSDKSNRAAYDQRVSGNVFDPKTSTPKQAPAPRGANGFYDFVETAFSGSRANKNSSRGTTSHSYAPHPAPKANPNTFWTICQKCSMQYEYLRVYVNQNLLCPNCHQPFVAVETPPPPPPPLDSKMTGNTSRQQHSKSKASKSSSNPKEAAGFEWTPFSKGGTSSVAHAASVVQQTYEKVKREREEASAAKRREKPSKRKHNFSEYAQGVSSNGHLNSVKKKKGAVEGSSTHTNQSFTGTAGFGVANTTPKDRNSETNQRIETKKMIMSSQSGIHDILMKKARVDICKWNQLKSDSILKSVEQNDNLERKIPDDKRRKKSDACYLNQTQVSATINPLSGATRMEQVRHTLESLSVAIQDPDFYDFDKNRTEMAFEQNQVWAAYDDADGMPRHYAIIQSVLSRDPFKVRISWLNSKTNTELGSLNWLGSGFSKTCGDFRSGRYEINSSLHSFSHKVLWIKGTQGVVHVFPRKGDVWALYRNWSPDWNELTAADNIYKYDLVEVLEDYDEEHGVIIVPLVKVAGFRSVFGQNLDRNQVRRIPREEMFRFSHQVPQHLLTSKDAPNVLKNCVELDPAATPPDLLHMVAVLTEDIEEEEIEDYAYSENPEEVHGGSAECQKESSVKQILVEKNEIDGNQNKVEIMNTS